ncbi:ATP-dependent DNA helicase [Rhizobium leguminosarum]|uniref:ATP-dependent DNA helicase n=1 Tax=Rhizobium leguminosarum TaxID=384 RepID=UPI0013BC502C|nr:ATP-dependent RecD-like DNA helicase [Rhizobium leguminosarum]NEH72321.1 AAA family ATPase [Rhizobium leguminosarum]
MQFSPVQSAAIDTVAGWFYYASADRPVFRIFGYAGTGKTTLARHFAEQVDGRVHYAAFTGKAAMVMRKNGCENATTIHSTIYNFDLDETTGRTSFKLKPKFELQGIKLFIIDECSMVDEDLGKDLLSFGIPVLVLGDPAQLPPVKGGGFFTNADPDVMLTEIHRQAQENPILRAATAVREGRPIKYGNYGALQIIGRGEVTAELVKSADQVLVGINKTRTAYNERLRELAGYKTRMPEPGDILVALKNDSTLGVFNGGLWKVLALNKQSKGSLNDLCVRMSVKSLDFDNAAPVDVRVREEFFQGRGHEVDWRELRGTQQFDFGYALTVHKSQGSQWQNVCLFDESSTFGADRGRHLYTGITRASETLTIVM